MFVDQAFIRVRAGKGGDGAVSFHRENMSRLAGRTAETADAAAMSSLWPIPIRPH